MRSKGPDMELSTTTRDCLLQSLAAVQRNAAIDSFAEMVRVVRACLAQASVRDPELELALGGAVSAVVLRKSRRQPRTHEPARTAQ
jgi:hypothetical protein